MFGKVIAFGLFEMIKKKVKNKKGVRTASLGSGSASGSVWVQRRGPSHFSGIRA